MQGEIKLPVDSGVRAGLDVVRMLAPGPDAVPRGRSHAYALAARGEAGGGRRGPADPIAQELRVAVTLTGARTIGGITRDSLVHA